MEPYLDRSRAITSLLSPCYGEPFRTVRGQMLVASNRMQNDRLWSTGVSALTRWTDQDGVSACIPAEGLLVHE
jgi:hypothetical protein